jgi:hypothetical protein
LWKQKILIMVAGAIGAGLGLASAGISAIMSSRDRRRAQRALAALGKRPELTVPKEVLSAYQERLRRSKMYQGFSQAELNQMRSAQARQQATLFNRAAGLGSSPMALQAIAANNAAAGWQDVAARNAAMNRQGQMADLSAADALAAQVGQYRSMQERSVLGNYDALQQMYGGAIQQARQNQANAISGIGTLGMTMATKPELWGYQSNSGSGGGGSDSGSGSTIGATAGGFSTGGLDLLGSNRNSSIFKPLKFD